MKKYILHAALLAVCVFILANIFATIAQASAYTIKPGDTLTSIASKFNTTISELASNNGIVNPDVIYAGKQLKVDSSEGAFGATSGYTPVTGYQSRTTSYISSSASTIPVASTLDPAGNQITLAGISPSSTVKVYMNLEAGTTRQEAIYCTGVTSASWTGCVRGLSFQGGDETASSTLQKPHNAGSAIIITNISQFYNQYVNIDGAQSIDGTKTFNSLPRASSTTAVPSSNDQLTPWYAAQTLVAGGFSSLNIDTSYGLTNAGTAPEKVRINASSTGGLGFDSAGKVYFSGVVNTSTIFNASEQHKSTETHSANVTFSSGVYVNTAGIYDSVSGLAANDLMIQRAVAAGMATGTAQVAITAGQALWLSSTSSQLMVTNTSAVSSTFQFIGIAASTTNAGGTVLYTKPGGINCFQSGLTSGLAYYLNGTAGQISSTPGTFSAKVGRATSAGCIQVIEPMYQSSGSFKFGYTNGQTSTTFVGFYPAHLTLVSTIGATTDDPGIVAGTCTGDERGISSCVVYDGTNYRFGVSATFPIRLRSGAASQVFGTISSRTLNSFVTTVDTASANTFATVYWSATNY